MRLDWECGFVARGTGDDELVVVTQAHARDAHLVDLTAEVILALAASPVAASDQSMNERTNGLGMTRHQHDSCKTNERNTMRRLKSPIIAAIASAAVTASVVGGVAIGATVGAAGATTTLDVWC